MQDLRFSQQCRWTSSSCSPEGQHSAAAWPWIYRHHDPSKSLELPTQWQHSIISQKTWHFNTFSFNGQELVEWTWSLCQLHAPNIRLLQYSKAVIQAAHTECTVVQQCQFISGCQTQHQLKFLTSTAHFVQHSSFLPSAKCTAMSKTVFWSSHFGHQVKWNNNQMNSRYVTHVCNKTPIQKTVQLMKTTNFAKQSYIMAINRILALEHANSKSEHQSCYDEHW
jgi:hypothetical protein